MPDIPFPNERRIYRLASKPSMPWRRRLLAWVRRDPKWMYLRVDGEIAALSRREAKDLGLR